MKRREATQWGMQNEREGSRRKIKFIMSHVTLPAQNAEVVIALADGKADLITLNVKTVYLRRVCLRLRDYGKAI